MTDEITEVIEHLDEVLAGLKDFQRATVASVLTRFQSGENNERMLVADEVGLGKTIVAKGVIAELLKERIERYSCQSGNTPFSPLRVTYICSNLTLANENRKKLAVFKDEAQEKYVLEPRYSRLLEIAVAEVQPDKNGKYLELCSLTPSTSFNLTQGYGNWRERLIIYFALIDHSKLSEYSETLSDFLSDGVKNWEEQRIAFPDSKIILPEVATAFHERLSKTLDVIERAKYGIGDGYKTALEALLAYSQSSSAISNSTHFKTYLRLLMARACAKHLSADLFILDEFQRFKSLLATQSGAEEALIAQQVFKNKQASKVLLLSATPFKAFSHNQDDENGEAHAAELNLLLRFLSHDNAESLQEYEQHRKVLQQQLLKLRQNNMVLDDLCDLSKAQVEGVLRQYISRTERSQISGSYEEVFSTQVDQCIDEFSSGEITLFKALAQLAKSLAEESSSRSTHQVMEFHKAAPWALSFLTGYQLRRQLDVHRSKLRGDIRRSHQGWLPRKAISSYRLKLDEAPHAKTRSLVKKLFPQNKFKTASEELLWVPPSLPHYPLQGSFEGQEDFSKTLLFSSWAIVPRALSGLISYEAERRLVAHSKQSQDYYKSKKSHTPGFNFSADSSLVGWSFIYPSRVMCELSSAGRWASLDELVNERESFFRDKLKHLSAYETSDVKSERWYAYAPFLLDYECGYKNEVCQWLDDYRRVIQRRKQDGRKGKQASYEQFLRNWNDNLLRLGKMPKDLARYLAYLSISSPSVVTVRALKSLYQNDIEEIRVAAGEVGEAAITLFNNRMTELVITKRHNNKKYFKSVIRYAADGDFQAVIEEYAHLLKGSGQSMDDAIRQLSEVLSLSDTTIDCQFREVRSQVEASGRRSKLRCHYALPLGNQKLSDEKGTKRISNVRDAFNSPFYPFVLNSTSIGQEGLDFHWYCLRIVHWNLPSNPIDIEQREGRVNRYKSLLVRRRIAEQYIASHPETTTRKLRRRYRWNKLFRWADKQTSSSRESDLIPYWHYPEGKAKIERFVPLMPLSQDVERLQYALKLLALYRLSFGQPRQEDLLKNLLERDFSKEEIALIFSKLMIDLSPLNDVKHH
ncbi:DEAD/DEAH box helicase [Leucothrix pacifica]|uniref:Helicase n=1 Tax=Leucothrix pacifica TaxID=1247513 RepID=A0A317CGV2_9GAMM|nr:DEAD/DEAH box helicase [Leucothrix pacifica]PWQ95472.1 helicase [Leucothrix pacifica]